MVHGDVLGGGPGVAARIAAVASVALVAACGSTPSPPPAIRVQRGVVATAVSASGALTAVTSQNLGFPKGAQLAELDVKVGDRVQAGQVLAKLDPFSFQQALAQQQAQLNQQRALLDKARNDTSVSGAQASLDQSKKIVDATKDNADAQHDADRQATDNARTQLNFSQTQLARARQQANQAGCDTSGRVGRDTDDGTDAEEDGAGRSSRGRGSGDDATDLVRNWYSSPGSGLLGVRHRHGSDDSTEPSAPATPTTTPTGGSTGGSTGSSTGSTATSMPTSTATSTDSSCTSLVSAVSTAQAQVISAQSGYDAAKSKQDVDQASGKLSVENARQSSVTAQNTLDSASADRPSDIAAQTALVANAQAAVALAQRDLDNTVLHAPVAGTVSAISGTVGEFLGSASSGTTALAPGTEASIPGVGAAATSDQAGNSASGLSATRPGGSAFIVLNNLNTFQVVIPFEESDAAKVAPNQPVEVTFDAIPGLTRRGTVLSVAPGGVNISGVTNYYATVVLSETDPRLRSGLTAEAAVQVNAVNNVLTVPNSAVIRQGQQAFVNTPGPDGKPVRTPFQAGAVGDDTTQVLSGLNEGQLILAPQSNSNGVGGGANRPGQGHG